MSKPPPSLSAAIAIGTILAGVTCLMLLQLLRRAPAAPSFDTTFAALDDSLPNGLDTLMDLSTVAARIERCRRLAVGPKPAAATFANKSSARQPVAAAKGCDGLIYIWSPLMPLSRLGIRNAAAASSDLGIDMMIVGGSELYTRLAALQAGPGNQPVGAHRRALEDALVQDLVAAGATIHYPAVIVHRQGYFVGGAIVGYKTTEAYRSIVHARLSEGGPNRPVAAAGYGASTVDVVATSDAASAVSGIKQGRNRVLQQDARGIVKLLSDIPAPPGVAPYFRSIPGHGAIAFEAERVVYLLDLDEGRPVAGPGHIDFIPGPAGRLFVTPAGNREGLEFYDATEVVTAARKGFGRGVEPVYVDTVMQDQYPSLGIVENAERKHETRTVYRILTSWFDRAVFRDYVVWRDSAEGILIIRPIGEPVVVCPGYQLSIPMLSDNGREVAGRDEATATTKIFQLSDDGACTEVFDLGMQTGKVAWSPDGRRIAFAIPQGAAPGTLSPQAIRELEGVFVLDRMDGRLTRVPGSGEVNRLTFPEFVGRDSVIFLVSSTHNGEGDTLDSFRLTCCIR
jgi:hypothetical protein